MKLLSKKMFVFAVFVIATAVPTALIAQAQGVYTWVDKHGVRHYSDTPHNPKAKEITINAPAEQTAVPAETAPGPATSATARKRHRVPMPRPHETAAQRAARCKKLRQEVKQLQSARRVKVTENGKTRFESGENLVKFRQKMHRRMEAACKSPQP